MKNLLLIDDSNVNSRLDRWFKRAVCEVPQSLIEKYIRKGNIKINNKRSKSSYKLQKGDQILINISLLKPKISKNKTEFYKASKKELSKSSSMFIEDNKNFVVLNKPAGIAVQSGTKSRRNILDILRSTKEFSEAIPYTVHRLDKETTGVLIVAKNRPYAQLFTSLFRMRKINKTYLGISMGEFEQKKGTFIDELFHYDGDKKVKTKAITHFTVLDSNRNCSLLKLNPETGRKHQLRKQLLIHGHPILGDSKYRISFKHPTKKNCLMLHAYKINFSIDKKKYSFSAEPPENFKNQLKEKYLKIF